MARKVAKYYKIKVVIEREGLNRRMLLVVAATGIVVGDLNIS